MNNLRKLRTKRNITQEEIAKHLDVSTSLICRFEKGTKDISFSLAVDVANFLNCSLDELAGRKNFTNRKED